MRFSQRIGQTPIRTALQIESIDKPLLNGLWNTITEGFFLKLDNNQIREESLRGTICLLIWRDFFKNIVRDIPRHSSIFNNSPIAIDCDLVINYCRKWYFLAKWYEIYDFIEYLAGLTEHLKSISFIERCNSTLRIEQSGYRIINYKVAQITTEEEIQAIEGARSNTDTMQPVQIHLQAALNMLTDRKNPDYRNSTKESISAIEAFCKILINDEKATLGKALNEIEHSYRLHKALKAAFSSLYGYTSDNGGIRHALLESDAELKFEDAKFMLVSCSAFINYLKAKTIEKSNKHE